MSGVKDPFEILADEITLIRREIDHLQRTSLNKEEAKALNRLIVESLGQMVKVGPALQQDFRNSLTTTALDIRQHAVEAAQSAARDAIKESHGKSLEAARSLSQAAGEARRQAWRYFGGFWVWLASIGATGALIGALASLWLTGKDDARLFGKYPYIYCKDAGGQVVKQNDGSSFCAVWIDDPK